MGKTSKQITITKRIEYIKSLLERKADIKTDKKVLSWNITNRQIDRYIKTINDYSRELEELRDSAAALLRELNPRPDARVTVRDTIYPGVTIEICQVLYRVETAIPRGSFYLDPESGEIKVTGT